MTADTFTFTCICCGKKQTFNGPTVEEAQGDAMRDGWTVRIFERIGYIATTEPEIESWCSIACEVKSVEALKAAKTASKPTRKRK